MDEYLNSSWEEFEVRADIHKQEDGVKRFEANTLTEKTLDFPPGQGKMME